MVSFLACSWRKVAFGAALGLTVAAAASLAAPSASAKATYESPYSYDRTWNAALRMVRVDMGFKVVEKDVESGYLLFEYRSTESGNKSTPGSFEMVRGREADSPVRVVMQLPQMPQYHEQMMIDALATKMRNEYGEPPPKKKPQPAPPDAGPPDAPAQPTPPAPPQ